MNTVLALQRNPLVRIWRGQARLSTAFGLVGFPVELMLWGGIGWVMD